VWSYPGYWVRFGVFRLSSLSRSPVVGSDLRAGIDPEAVASIAY
jgi:hypothetical protein